MKIIDAHLHIFPSEPRTDAMAEKVGHVNSVEHLREVCGQLEIVHGVVMGNRSLDVGFHNYPTDLFHYCVGLDSLVLDRGETIPKDLPDQVEEHLKRENCCGVKLYPGYNKIWLTDPIYQPIYELAAGQSLGLTVQILSNVQDLGGLVDPALDLRFVHLTQLQGEFHVLPHGHVGIQSVALEDHGDVAVLGLHIVDQAVVDAQLALGDLLQAGHHTQGGGLTAAGGSNQNDKLLVGDLQVEIAHRGDVSVIDLEDVLKAHSRHGLRP